MSSSDLNPLAKQYLRRLKRVARCLPRERRTELLAEIEAHLNESVAPGSTDLEVQQALDRLGSPEQIVAADLPAPPPLQPVGNGREVGAIILLLLGGFIFWIGWFVGLFLLWTSKLWTVTDKLIGTFIIPGGLSTLLIVGVGTASSGTCLSSSSGPTHCTTSGGSGFFGILLLAVLLLAPVGAAIYLGWRARSARRIFNVTVLAAAAA